MEDVLEVYQRPRDPECPLVCLDETSKQMIVETREPIAAKPGRKARHDYEYARNGVANLFMMFAPLEGWRVGYKPVSCTCEPSLQILASGESGNVLPGPETEGDKSRPRELRSRQRP